MSDHARDALLPVADGRPDAYKWGVALLLTACFTLSYIDRQIISLLVEPIKASLQLSDTQLGLVQGVSFSLFYVCATLPLAWLADRGNRSAIMSVCIAVWSAMTAACGLASNFWQLLFARVGVAMGEAGLPPAALTTMADIFEPRRLAVATSLFMLAPFIGGGLALLGGGALYAATANWTMPTLPGVGTLERWQLVFMLVGAPGVLAALAVALVRDPRRDRPAQARTQTSAMGAFVRAQWRFVAVYMLCIALTSMLLTIYISWLPAAMMRSKGIDERTVGLFFGPVFLITGAAGTLLAGVLVGRGGNTDPVGYTLRLMRRAMLALWPIAVAGPLMPLLGAELVLMGAAIFLISSVIGMSSLPLQYVAPKHLRAQSIALMGMISALLGTGLGPLLAGVLSDSLGSLHAQPLSLALSLIAALSVPATAWLLGLVGRRHARLRLDRIHGTAEPSAAPASFPAAAASAATHDALAVPDPSLSTPR